MYLQIYGNNVLLPSPSSISIGDELVWSSNTGRSVTAEMIGDIIASKSTLTITWRMIPYSSIDIIKSNVSDINNPFKNITLQTNTGDVLLSFDGYRGTLNIDSIFSVGTELYASTVTTDIIQQ